VADRPTTRGSGKGWWYLLLILPFIALLYVPFYASSDPQLAGFPYFYWYQFLWVLLGAAVTAIVYFSTRRS
jgi:hypothetical protein